MDVRADGRHQVNLPYATPGVLPSSVRNALGKKHLSFFASTSVRKCMKLNGLDIEGGILILDENLSSPPYPLSRRA
jgi:hypothetical protein